MMQINQGRFIFQTLLTVFILFWVNLVVAQEYDAYSQKGLKARVDFYYDESAQLDYAEIQQPNIAQLFQPQTGSITKGYVTGALWFKLELETTENRSSDWYLSLNNALLDDVRLYELFEDKNVVLKLSGTAYPYAERPFEYRNPSFILQLEKNKKKTFFLRVSGDNSMAFSLRLAKPDDFIARTNLESMGLGFFIAVHVFLLVGNLWIFFASKDISYALLAVFGFNGLIGFLTIEGLTFQYVFPNMPEMIDYIIMVPYMMGMPLYVFFLLHYLKIFELYEVSSKIYLISLIVFAFVSINIGVFYSFPLAMFIYQFWNVINSILLIPTIVLLTRNVFPYTYVVLAACFVLNIGVLIRISRNLGYLPDGDFQYYSYFFGVIGHLILMNVVASLTFRDSLAAKDKVLTEALKTAQEAEKKLEEKVTKRTSSLRHALDLVKTTLEFERQAQEDQRLFFETVSHELRTPLAVIDAAAKNMELDAHEFDEVSKKRFQRIQRATAQLSDLVKRCFREDRFEPLNRGLRRRHAQLQTLVTDACDSLAFSPQKHQLSVNLDNLPDTFLCDPDMTRLALRTIVGNAAKYSSAGSSIWIKGSYDEKGLTLKIIDNGPGVAERDLPHLFKRYYRGSNASHVSGTGLGLPLARELIQIQGGHMRIDSVLGKGFEVTIFLPIYQPTPERQELDDIPNTQNKMV